MKKILNYERFYIKKIKKKMKVKKVIIKKKWLLKNVY